MCLFGKFAQDDPLVLGTLKHLPFAQDVKAIMQEMLTVYLYLRLRHLDRTDGEASVSIRSKNKVFSADSVRGLYI